jgi:hypothetical protein
MRKVVWAGVFISVGLVGSWLASTHRNDAWAQVAKPPTIQEVAQYIALTSDAGEGHQQVTVIDTQSRAMSVYHIDHATGAITLKSVRSIEADLLLDEFNTESPLPREIRAMLNKR